MFILKAKLIISQPTYPERRSLHAVVQATVHDVLLTCPGHSSVELFTWSHGDLSSNSPKPSLQAVLDRLEKMVVRFSLVLECQSSITDMVKILQPLEITKSKVPQRYSKYKSIFT